MKSVMNEILESEETKIARQFFWLKARLKKLFSLCTIQMSMINIHANVVSDTQRISISHKIIVFCTSEEGSNLQPKHVMRLRLDFGVLILVKIFLNFYTNWNIFQKYSKIFGKFTSSLRTFHTNEFWNILKFFIP